MDASLDSDRRLIELLIEDDGDGLEAAEIDHMLNRGSRLDEAIEGQGIGLAVVADIVASYDIDLQFARGRAGGLQVRLQFQAA